jgi:dihydrofolate reductase
MRKLKLQVQITIDGFICGPNGEMDWMTFNWSNDLIDFVREITEPIDTILLGKNLAMGFIPHWANVASDPKNPEYEAGIKFTETPKVVFSKTITESQWENTVMANGDLVKEVNAIKTLPGNDIIAYGGSKFVSSLIREKLIDELHLFVNPVVIGTGMTIFNDVKEKQNFELLGSKSYDCGITVLSFKSIL